MYRSVVDCDACSVNGLLSCQGWHEPCTEFNDWGVLVPVRVLYYLNQTSSEKEMKKFSRLIIAASLMAGFATASVAGQGVRDAGTPAAGAEPPWPTLEIASPAGQGTRDNDLPFGWEELSRLSEAEANAVVGEFWFRLGFCLWICVNLNNTMNGDSWLGLKTSTNKNPIVRLGNRRGR